MPIIFAPPSPLGSSASIGIGAGIAEQNAKMFPTLASLYAHIASLRAQGGGHGGGGGYGGGGGIQVLPRDDQGALYQVEAQANREQRSQDLAEQLGQPDYVMGHIKERENYQLQQQQSAQQARQQELARLNPVAKEPAPPQWGQAEQDSLTEANQVVARAKKEIDAGQLAPENANALMAPYQDKIQALTQQQEAFQQYQQNKQFQAASQAQAQKRALVDTDIRHAADNGMRQVPDLPTPIYDLDQHGKKYMVNHEVYKAAAADRKSALEHNQGVELKNKEAEAKASEAEEKHFHEDRAAATKELTHKDADGKPIAPTHEQISERARQIGEERAAAKEERGLVKNANPQIRAAYVDHLDSIPKVDGKADWNQGSNGQLAQLGRFLSDPKAVGVTKKEAEAGIAKIRKILQDRITPPPVVSPPPPLTAIKPDLSNYQKPPASGAFFSDTMAGSY